jgi:hypothetical protein
MKTFSSEKKAEQWARAFDYARSLLVPPLAPLVVEQRADGEWIVVENGTIEGTNN